MSEDIEKESTISAGRVVACGVLLAMAISILGFAGLSEKSFWASHVESRRSEVAKQMVNTGDYLIPRVNGEKIFTKPPLFFWMIAGSYKLTGEITEWSSRLPSVIFGFMTLGLLFWLGVRLYDPLTALFSVAVLATSHLYLHYMRLAEMDVSLTFFVTLSFLLLTYISPVGSGKVFPAIAFWTALALGFLIKGPFAVIFPIAGFLAFILFEKEGKFESVKKAFSPWGILIFLMIVSPWFLYVIFYDDAWRVFNEEAIGRITSSRGKSHGLFFYLESLSNFAPWVLLLPFAILRGLSSDIEKSGRASAWLIGGLVAASVISGKNIHYILPLYPIMALLVGRLIASCANGEAGEPLLTLTNVAGILIAIVVAFAFSILPAVSFFTQEVPTINPVVTISMIPLMLFLLWLTFSDFSNGKYLGMWEKVTASVLVLFIFAYSIVVPALNTRHSYKDFLLKVKGVDTTNSEIVMYNMENFQAPFYLDITVPPIWDEDGLKKLMEKAKNDGKSFFIITKKKDLARVSEVTLGKTIYIDDVYVPATDGREDRRLAIVSNSEFRGL